MQKVKRSREATGSETLISRDEVHIVYKTQNSKMKEREGEENEYVRTVSEERIISCTFGALFH